MLTGRLSPHKIDHVVGMNCVIDYITLFFFSLVIKIDFLVHNIASGLVLIVINIISVTLMSSYCSKDTVQLHGTLCGVNSINL